MAARLTTYLVVGIVAATLIAGLIVGAQRDDNEGPVDLIVHNANVYTADENGAPAEAVAIRGNHILRVGSNREIYRLRQAQTTVIDAGGATVLPGFNDANVRLVEGGLAILKDGRHNSDPADAAGESPAGSATRAERLDAVQAAVTEAHRLGITSVHDVGATPEDIEMYDELRRAGDLALRVYAALELEGPFDESLLTRLAALWKDFSDDPRFKTGAVILELAAKADAPAEDVRGPFAQPGSAPAMEADELNRFVRLLDAQGWQILAEAHGQATVRLALDAYLHAERSNQAPERGRRHRIEGAEAASGADLPRFAELGVIASIQPGQVDDGPARPGAERSLAALDSSDTPLVLGSGWPSAPLDPMVGLEAAVTGLAMSEELKTSVAAAEHRVSLEAAVNAYTSGGAYASFDEQRKGTLRPGMLADIVVLSDDIFAAPSSRLGSTAVAITIFDGKVVYRRHE
ncbi:MAG: amidohydrolase family protein [Acidobacteria bacterium]|nr:amidohydrolase family protein [Acidobacteriota bacterium]